MSKNRKLYIPISCSNDYKKPKFTLINIQDIKELEEIIPSNHDIIVHVLKQRTAKEQLGKDYQPIQIQVSEEKFNIIEALIKQKHPRNTPNNTNLFRQRAFDIVSDLNTPILVQIVQIY